MTVYKAPDWTPFNTNRLSGETSVFLAGSIEMGKAENWQGKIGKAFSTAGFIVLDPRRDDWDSSWEQTIENENFLEQVKWELTGIEKADAVFVYFDPNTRSPIALLEVGMLSQLKPEKTIIVCPMGFWRRGNVEIMCARYSMALYETMEEGIAATIHGLIWREKHENKRSI